MRFPKKLPESAGSFAKYKRKSMHMFMTWAHLTLPEDEALKLRSFRTHPDSIFNDTIPNTYTMEHKEGVGQYRLVNTLLVVYMEIPGNLRYGLYRVPLDDWEKTDSDRDGSGGRISPEIADFKIGGRFLSSGKYFPTRAEHNDFLHQSVKTPVYLVVSKGSEECPV